MNGLNTTLKAVFIRPIALCLLTTVYLVFPEVWASNSCEACHKSSSFFVQNKRIYTYYQHWLLSPHKAAGVTCNQCHGGNPEAETKEAAHQGVRGQSDPESWIFFKTQPETCGACHEGAAKHFTKSKHYRALMDDESAPTCSTCHRAMNLKPYYREIVHETCKTCHDAKGLKQLPHVAEKALEILDRLNITKGYLGWSAVYYKEKNWPGDTQQKLSEFWESYRRILADGHSFNLFRSDEASIELLTRLKVLFRKAWILKQEDQRIKETIR